MFAKETRIDPALSCINATARTYRTRRSRFEGRCFTRILRNEDGQTMAEYAFIASLVAAGCAAAFTSLGQEIVTLLGPVANALKP